MPEAGLTAEVSVWGVNRDSLKSARTRKARTRFDEGRGGVVSAVWVTTEMAAPLSNGPLRSLSPPPGAGDDGLTSAKVGRFAALTSRSPYCLRR